MLFDPENFQKDNYEINFGLGLDRLKIGEREEYNISIPVCYTGNRIILDLTGQFDFNSDFNIIGDSSTSARIYAYRGKCRFEVLVTSANASLGPSTFSVLATPDREPLLIPHTENYVSFKAIMLSPPKLIEREVNLTVGEDRSFVLRPMGKKGSEYLLVTSKHRGATDEIFKDTRVLNDFMLFMKGTHCGFGHSIGIAESGSTAFEMIGFTRHDSCKHSPNWFDLHAQSRLPEIFRLFASSFDGSIRERALRQALNFYRASNASRDVSIEMSIIAAHGALEALTNFILEYQAGWFGSLSTERISFCDKLRAASAYIGISDQIMKHSENLERLSRSRNNMDPFEILSFIRNKIVHQDPKYLPKGLELHEAWLMMQWLVEVLIFGIIGYEGEIVDRRIYRGWSGQKCTLKFRR
ncbi:hypothetical protein [Paracoccus sp. SY]|uniref:hypothetical protein n=1 Tax=Paracoccus sp. SY TaxID=1330255 RepID=UPI0011AED04C|nr:hypothetical protein [Paracoccus sp. SY]